ncbi:response regulator [Rubrivirga sp. S365]|uniref:Response regulator n=1 Tax=Rubrivirga litoralis TaxID=3075598 RepID=A0ABU3BP84_9BACT|nr:MULTISPECIES: response regulator [unclassified Rubrivirga]MDT0631087.1 response regulator [Rubrivirga sp. F394]MDT7855400.1 response regulator [Rubrivirga sp. S365]
MEVSGVTLLLVEDDHVDAEAIQRAFRQHRIANPFVVVRDGVEALAALRGDPGAPEVPHPHVVLLDINMPRMNGIEFLEALRADPGLSRTVVFVLTTSDREEDKVAAYDHHVAGYILKSRAGADFLEVVKLLKVYWRLIEFPPDVGAAPAVP